MSTETRTLPARRSMWPAMALALLVVTTLAILATTMPATTDQPDGRFAGGRFAGRHLVNTPSEVSSGVAGFVGGTAANTPSELSGAFKRGRPGQVGQRGAGAVISSPAEWPRTADATAAAEGYSRQQR